MILANFLGIDGDQLLVLAFGFVGLMIILTGLAVAFSKYYHKPGPEEAIVRTGVSGLKAMTGKGMIDVPLIQEAHVMDLSVKRILIARDGEDRRRGHLGLERVHRQRGFVCRPDFGERCAD